MTRRLHLPALGPRDRRALLLGAWIVVPVLLATVVVRPVVATLLELRDSVERERMLLGRELRLVADAPGDRALLRITERALNDAAPRLFGGSEPVTASAELARYVRSQATASGLVLEQTETETVFDDVPPIVGASDGGGSRAGADTATRPLRVTIRAHGGTVAIVDFLEAMEEGPRLVRVERIGVSRGVTSGVPDRGALTFTATLTGLARSRFRVVGTTGGAPMPGATLRERGTQ